METSLNVQVLSYTPDFEQNIVRGAKLCYSSSDIGSLKEKVIPEEAKRFLNMILKIGHGSILEHSSITFGIEGISRSLSHQLVRHRIGCSYSQKSQRYVLEGDFNYIVPQEIKNNSFAYERFIKSMEEINNAYIEIQEALFENYIINANEDLKSLYENNYDINKLDKLINTFIKNNPNLVNSLKKKAAENARAVLPNACETKIQVTMNVRALFNFFKERLCNRAQDEIREMAYQMWLECMKISPTIFQFAVPTCVNGKCKEGNMTCGKANEVKEKFKNNINK